MTNNDVTLAMLNSVAIKLGSLIDESILVGGIVTGFLVTDALVGDFRATDDVDLVFEIGTRLEYYKLEETLRSLGLSQDSTEHAPICRWVINGIKVDIMPTNTAVLGFENLWYDEAFKKAILITLSPGMNIKIISAPILLRQNSKPINLVEIVTI